MKPIAHTWLSPKCEQPEGLHHFAWANADRHDYPPIRAADDVARRLEGREDRPWALMLHPSAPGLYDGFASSRGDWFRYGPLNCRYTEWVRNVCADLSRRGLFPNRIVLDNESAPVTWRLDSDKIERILANETARGSLPWTVTHWPDGTPRESADFHWSHRQATNDWNRWAVRMHAALLRMYVHRPAIQGFGRYVPASNYGDMAYPVCETTLFDLNGWPVTSTSVDESSPSLYIGDNGHRYRRAEKERRWNIFVDAVRDLVACVAGERLVAPWIRFDQDHWLASRLIEIGAELGVSEWLAFNWHHNADDDAAMRDALQSVEVKPRDQRGLIEQMPELDADEINVRGVVVRYEDWKG